MPSENRKEKISKMATSDFHSRLALVWELCNGQEHQQYDLILCTTAYLKASNNDHSMNVVLSDGQTDLLH